MIDMLSSLKRPSVLLTSSSIEEPNNRRFLMSSGDSAHWKAGLAFVTGCIAIGTAFALRGNYVENTSHFAGTMSENDDSDWELIDETDAFSDEHIQTLKTSIYGEDSVIQVTIKCIGNEALKYEFAAFDKNERSRDMALMPNSVEQQFIGLNPLIKFRVRLDNGKPIIGTRIRPRYENVIVIGSEDAVMNTGPLSSDLRVASTITLGLAFSDGEDTAYIDQTPEVVRSFLDDCGPVEDLGQPSKSSDAAEAEVVDPALQDSQDVGDVSAPANVVESEPTVEEAPLKPNLSRRPSPRRSLAQLVTFEDYPSQALRNNDQGTVSYELLVGSDGRVQSCRIVRSSGSALLDQTTCRIIQQRGRFNPATDVDGSPIVANFSGQSEWRIE